MVSYSCMCVPLHCGTSDLPHVLLAFAAFYCIVWVAISELPTNHWRGRHGYHSSYLRPGDSPPCDHQAIRWFIGTRTLKPVLLCCSTSCGVRYCWTIFHRLGDRFFFWLLTCYAQVETQASSTPKTKRGTIACNGAGVGSALTSTRIAPAR